VRQSGEALLVILNDVLDISKIEAGKLTLELIDFDLGEIIQGAHSAFAPLAHDKGLTFDVDIQGAEGLYRGDPTRVRQILFNLISNAIKFTATGEIRVRAKVGEGGLVLVVSDTGEGIAPENRPWLFTKFTQADVSTTRRFGGTGLGLSICRELAELMGGHIDVESRLGEGSTFTVHLNLPRVGAPRELTPAAPSDRPVDAAGLRVLAAEDNAVNQLVIKTLLEQAGIEPVVVANGALAVEAWEKGVWDLILMDIQMPVMDGLEATRIIRGREAQLGRPRTPILALTADTMSHQADAYAAADMDGLVSKPIEVSSLFDALQSALTQAGTPDRLAV
jgi:CheY-like chemotaxis protein